MKKLLSLILLVSLSLFVVSCGKSSDGKGPYGSGGGTGSGTKNKAPTANAGEDKSAIVGDSVTLDGSGSNDSDGNITSYGWFDENNNSLSTDVKYTTNSLTQGTHTITLKVTDDDGASATDKVVITVSLPDNKPPTANAGYDQDITVGDSVTLDGSGSKDSDGNITSYEWFEGDTLLGSGETYDASSLTEDVHTITLKVTDDDGASATDEVVVTVNPVVVVPNNPPEIVGKNIGTLKDISGGHGMMASVATPNQSFTFTFNEDDLALGSINENSFVLNRLINYRYEKVPSTLSLSGNVLTLKPNEALAPGIYIVGMNKKVKDTSGLSLIGDSLAYVGDYTIYVEPASEDLSVKSIEGASGGDKVKLDENIIITFDKPIDKSTLNTDNLTISTIRDSDDTGAFNETNVEEKKFSFTYSLSTDNLTLTIDPDADLISGEQYDLKLRNMKDMDGNYLTTKLMSYQSFTAETASGHVSYPTDIDDETFENSVLSGNKYTVAFSKNLDSNTVTKENVKFCTGKDAFEYKYAISSTCNSGYNLSLSGADLDIKPTETIEDGTLVAMSFTNDIKAGDGEYVKNKSSFFNVEKDSDITKSSSGGVNAVTFNNPLNPDSVKLTDINFYKRDNVNSKWIPADSNNFTLTLSSDHKTLTIKPKEKGIYRYFTDKIKDVNGKKVIIDGDDSIVMNGERKKLMMFGGV